jgi:hypothetical protein
MEAKLRVEAPSHSERRWLPSMPSLSVQGPRKGLAPFSLRRGGATAFVTRERPSSAWVVVFF